MSAEKIGDLPVNNGSGLFDDDGLFTSLITDLNKLPRLLIDNQFIAACDLTSQMAQKIATLNSGTQKEKEEFRNKIEELKRQNSELMEQLSKKDGVNDGSN